MSTAADSAYNQYQFDCECLHIYNTGSNRVPQLQRQFQVGIHVSCTNSLGILTSVNTSRPQENPSTSVELVVDYTSVSGPFTIQCGGMSLLTCSICVDTYLAFFSVGALGAAYGITSLIRVNTPHFGHRRRLLTCVILGKEIDGDRYHVLPDAFLSPENNRMILQDPCRLRTPRVPRPVQRQL